MRFVAAIIAACFSSSLVLSEELSISIGYELSLEGALFYDRGHYWIEVAIKDASGRDTLPRDLTPSQFEICKVDGCAECFNPSRLEIIRNDSSSCSIVLVSSKIEPRACYRVSFRPSSGASIARTIACDPFSVDPDSSPCAAKAFLARYIAPAFARQGDCYRLNRLYYEYDVSGASSAMSFVLEPGMRLGPLSFELLAEETSLSRTNVFQSRSYISHRTYAVKLGIVAWIGKLRYSPSLRAICDRSTVDRGNETISRRDDMLELEFRIRFDNLFDSFNSTCKSVFEGIEAAFGYDWVFEEDSSKGPLPFSSFRASWTFLYGLRISYSISSYMPNSECFSLSHFQSFRFALLLRGILDSYPGKPWHPDLEFAWDKGRRYPLSFEEEKISVSFTFDLYPW